MVAIFLPQLAIRASISSSVGMNGIFCCCLYIGGIQALSCHLRKLSYAEVARSLVVELQSSELASAFLTDSGSFKSAPLDHALTEG